ncbi:unnamed protein product [Blepharisma stoltei]|uniref:Cyclic nucleotide-binding domain-containing protein n=1 Tax=Blepharisma stoltei TaxID=1481888 RepID=A0AAU9J3X7_9CILI|nr:unnamed protein product [Blepharisma stoltei]
MSLIGFLKKRNDRKILPKIQEDTERRHLFNLDSQKFSEEDISKPATISTDPNETFKNPNELPPLKYKEVWQRAKRKLIMSIRIKRLLKDKEIYGPSSALFMGRDEQVEAGDAYFRKKACLILSHEGTSLSEESLPKGIIHPGSKCKACWDIFVGIILLYTAITTPFVLAFVTTSDFDFWFWMDFFIDLSFLSDTIVQLNTAFYSKEGKLMYTRKQIFWNYLKGWLIIDVLASIPLGMIEALVSVGYPGGINHFIKFFRLKSLPRLFRLSKLTKFMKNKEAASYIENIQGAFSINYTAMRMISAISAIIICLHIVACLWFYTAKADDFSTDTWVFRYHYLDNDIWTLYLTCIYWGTATLATVGYGDIAPYSNSEKFLAMFWMVCGVYFLSFTISSLSTMLTKQDLKKNIVDYRLSVADEFVKEARISGEIKKKMQKTIRQFTEKNGFTFDEKEELINELPKHLRYEIAMNMHHGAIRLFSFFTLKDYSFIASIVPYLQPLLVDVNEIICNVGEAPQNIYFIVNGKVSYIKDKEGIVYRTLQQGHYFGDIELVKKVARKYKIVASTDTFLLIMGKKTIEKIQLEFPTVWKEIGMIAEERDRKIKKALAETLALYKANKAGKIQDLKADEFRELINQEIGEENCETEDEEGNFKFSIRMRNKEILKVKKQINKNTECLERIEQLMEKIMQKQKKIPILPSPPVNYIRRSLRGSLPQINIGSISRNPLMETSPSNLTEDTAS